MSAVLERGMLFRGRVIPGSEFVLRHPNAWYTRGDDDVYARSGPIRLLTAHWTAGPRRVGELAALRTYAAMQARRKENGDEMSVSAQFVQSDDGLIFQLADLELCCIHADRAFNQRGISIEYTMPGTQARATEIGRPEEGVERLVAGTKVLALRPSAAALATFARFANLIAGLFGDTRFKLGSDPLFELERRTYTRRTRLRAPEMQTCSGVLEHFHAASTTKVDAAGWFVDHLAANGWPEA